MTTRIELSGRVLQPPEIRVTPAGTESLHLMVDCGDHGRPLILPVVMAGASVRTIGRRFGKGDTVRAIGALRAMPQRAAVRSFEVIAERIEAGAAD